MEKVLEEVDEDIKNFMLADSITKNGDGFYKNWELAFQPNIYVLMWQELRDRKKNALPSIPKSK